MWSQYKRADDDDDDDVEKTSEMMQLTVISSCCIHPLEQPASFFILFLFIHIAALRLDCKIHMEI